MRKCFVTSVLLLLFLVGCNKEVNEETGKTTYKLNPIVSKQVEDSVEGAAGFLNALVPFYPPAGAIGVTLLTALGIWKKKIKPNYVKAQTEANLYHTTTRALVLAIEELKKNDPASWKTLKEELNVGPQVENAIRALRNLPAKE